MRAALVGVGTEILLGQIANSNAQWMSERLAEIGVDVVHHQAVGDNLDRIADAFRLALSRADVVIATGGLGPTQDDITREGIAAALGVRLVRHPEIEEFLREKFRGFGRPMPEINLIQADVPEGARYILPVRGTAPGLICSSPGGPVLYAVPGVPAEMREMMEGRSRLGDHVFTSEDEELEHVVGRLLRERGMRVALAESLTGGGLAQRLTSAEGASDYFCGSAVVYTADAKRDLLGVRQETIDGPGVVSEECAREMAAGARRVFGADVAVSLTGVAGPDPHDGKPPGDVWVALDAGDVQTARHLRAPGDRAQVVRWSQQAGLDILRRFLEGRLEG